MTLETFLLWVVIGAIAGFLASAIVGGWLFRALGWHAPFTGMAGTVFVAFIGALVLLLLLRVLRVGTARRI